MHAQIPICWSKYSTRMSVAASMVVCWSLTHLWSDDQLLGPCMVCFEAAWCYCMGACIFCLGVNHLFGVALCDWEFSVYRGVPHTRPRYFGLPQHWSLFQKVRRSLLGTLAFFIWQEGCNCQELVLFKWFCWPNKFWSSNRLFTFTTFFLKRFKWAFLFFHELVGL